MIKRLIKVLLFLAICCVYSQQVLAQNGQVRGFIYDAKSGEAIGFATVRLENSSFGAYTDEKGLFSIQNVTPGNYTIIVTYVGYDTTRKSIQIKANNITKG